MPLTEGPPLCELCFMTLWVTLYGCVSMRRSIHACVYLCDCILQSVLSLFYLDLHSTYLSRSFHPLHRALLLIIIIT